MALRFQCCWSRCPRSIQFQPVASHGQRHSVLDLGLVTSRPWDPWDPWVSGCFQARSKFTWHNKKAVVVSRESFHLSSSSPSSFTPAQKMSVFRIIFTEFNLFQPNFAEDYLWQLPSSPRRGHMISHDSWSPIGYMRIYAVHIHRYTVYHLINAIKYQYIMHTYWHMCIHMSYVGIYNPCIYCIYIHISMDFIVLNRIHAAVFWSWCRPPERHCLRVHRGSLHWFLYCGVCFLDAYTAYTVFWNNEVAQPWTSILMDNEVLRILLARGPRCEVPRCFWLRWLVKIYHKISASYQILSYQILP